MFDKMKGLMEMKKQADRLKHELEGAFVDVHAVKGIKITVSGSQNFKSIEIDESIVQTGNKDQLEQDLLKSVNAAIRQSQDLAAQKMKDVMPGLPGV